MEEPTKWDFATMELSQILAQVPDHNEQLKIIKSYYEWFVGEVLTDEG